MKTLILDNFDSFTYNLFQYIAELGGNPEVHRNNAITLEEIERGGYTHIVISPGPGSPDNKKDFGICGDVIKQFKGKIPILGVCLGHQGIIHYLGGRVMRAPIPMHGKRSMIRINTSNVLFHGFPETIEVMRYHSLIGETETLPNELEITGKTEDNLIMAVAHKTLPLFGVQFHPESIGTPFGKEILKNFFSATKGNAETSEKPLRRTHNYQNSLSMTEKEAERVIDEIVSGDMNEDEITDTLLSLSRKGESIAEITGMACGLRKHAVQINFNKPELTIMDTCGTGGSGLSRMNISTTAAFVLAAGGVTIAKHGNRAASGRSGSFDLLEVLGVNIQFGPTEVSQAVKNIGIGFVFAPLFHPAMKRVASVRKKLGIRTIFNLIGPLVNPARPEYHLLGTTEPAIAEKLIAVMKNLQYHRAMVVAGEDGLDDVTLTGKTHIFELQNGEIKQYTFEPEETGMARVKFEEIAGGTPEENAKTFLLLLAGKASEALQNLLLLNSAFGFLVRDIVRNVQEGISLSRRIIESRDAYEKFLEYKKFSNNVPLS